MSDTFYLDVPYVEKDEAKALGATWDPDARSWITTTDHLPRFERWRPYAPTPAEKLEFLPSLEASPEHVYELQKYAQDCELSEWLLLLLPGDQWGAFWLDDLDGPATTAVMAGDYATGCRFVSDSRAEVMSFMLANRLYTGSLLSREAALNYQSQTTEDLFPQFCMAELRIGDRSITIQLPAACASLITRLPSDAPVPTPSSHLSMEVFEYLDLHCPSDAKRPLIDRLNLARTMSFKMSVPLLTEVHLSQDLCEAFIEQHKSSYTLYQAIYKLNSISLRPTLKIVFDYIKWAIARDMLKAGTPWEFIAESLGVKTKSTLVKYARQADEAEKKSKIKRIIKAPLFSNLIQIGLQGGNVDQEVEAVTDLVAYPEFNRERLIRRMLEMKALSRK
jgi:hypothetical protein